MKVWLVYNIIVPYIGRRVVLCVRVCVYVCLWVLMYVTE